MKPANDDEAVFGAVLLDLLNEKRNEKSQSPGGNQRLGKEGDVSTMVDVEGLRKREHDLLDRDELRHYHRIAEKKAEKRGPVFLEVARKQGRTEMFRLVMGDRKDLDKHREMKVSGNAAAYFENRHEAVEGMTRDQLLDQRKNRILQSKGNDTGRGGW